MPQTREGRAEELTKQAKRLIEEMLAKEKAPAEIIMLEDIEQAAHRVGWNCKRR